MGILREILDLYEGRMLDGSISRAPSLGNIQEPRAPSELSDFSSMSSSIDFEVRFVLNLELNDILVLLLSIWIDELQSGNE